MTRHLLVAVLAVTAFMRCAGNDVTSAAIKHGNIAPTDSVGGEDSVAGTDGAPHEDTAATEALPDAGDTGAEPEETVVMETADEETSIEDNPFEVAETDESTTPDANAESGNGDIEVSPDLCAKVTCDKGTECVTWACNPETGFCDPEVTGASCDDQDPCTDGDLCRTPGICAGTPKSCDDGNPCTDDSCVADVGCVSVHNTDVCDDGNPCTSDDACSGGLCAGANTCTACAKNEDCAPYEDENLCNGTLACVQSECVVAADSIVQCQVGDACTFYECQPKTGICQKFVIVGAGCQDGNPCTTGETCSMNGCGNGKPVACSTDNPCAWAFCNPKTGGCETQPIPDNVACDDNDPCTTSTYCTAGTCGGGKKVAECGPCTSNADCDSSKDSPCSKKKCNLTTSTCGFEPEPEGKECSDNDDCTTNDHCNGLGGCTSGSPLNCDDGTACTDDWCAYGWGCKHQAVVCDSSGDSPCEKTYCDPEQGCITVVAQDTTPCTTTPTPCFTAEGTCKEGVCVGNLACNDENPCTDNGCTFGGECVFTPNTAPCNDGNPCTEGDFCQDSECAAGVMEDCASDNPCLFGYCDPETGACTTEPAADVGFKCTDNDPCTVDDTCEGGVCVSGLPPNCDDNDPCTYDACAGNGACTHTWECVEASFIASVLAIPPTPDAAMCGETMLYLYHCPAPCNWDAVTYNDIVATEPAVITLGPPGIQYYVFGPFNVFPGSAVFMEVITHDGRTDENACYPNMISFCQNWGNKYFELQLEGSGKYPATLYTLPDKSTVWGANITSP